MRGKGGQGRRAGTRGGFRLSAVLLVLVQLVGLGHLAFARHGLCWEHGVVVELDGASAGPAEAETTPAPGLDRSSALSARSGAHPHCPALWLHRQLSPSPAPPLALAPTVPADRGRVGDAIPPAWRTALDRAPKQSPPA